MSFQRLSERVQGKSRPPESRWKVIPQSRTSGRETPITEFAMCSWHTQLPHVIGIGPRWATTNVRQKATVVCEVRGSQSDKRLMHEPRDLEHNALTDWSHRLAPVTRRAAAFCTDYRRRSSSSLMPNSSELRGECEGNEQYVFYLTPQSQTNILPYNLSMG